jgi:uncharacterized RDD family membrane protein YckC
MTSRPFKAAAILCVTFVAGTAVMASAHSSVHEARSTLASLERAATIVEYVLARQSSAGRSFRLVAAQDEPPAAQPPAPATPSSRTAGRRGAAAPAVPAPSATGERPVMPGTSAPDAPAQVFNEPVRFQRVRPIFRLGQDYVIRQGDTVEDVVIVLGGLRVEGRVRGDVVVVLGNVDLADTAEIDGDLVNVGGGVSAAQGALLRGDLVSVGGALTAPATFSPGGEQVVVGTTDIGNRLRAIVPWITYGLMLGRPIVPSLRWVWAVVGIFFLISLVLSLVFEAPVRVCAEAVRAKPLTTFLTGLLILLLVGPISFILAVSIVGIVVIPFLVCALLIAWVIGKIAVARWLGWSVVGESEPDSRAQAARSVVIGLVLLTLAYMVPLLGLVTWVMVGVLGLGAATSTVFKALRRENPAPPKAPKAPQPPAPLPPVPPAYSATPLGAEPARFVESTTEGDASAAAAPVAGAAEAGAGVSAPAPVTDGSDAGLLALPRATLMQRLAAGALDGFLVFIVYQLMDPRNREFFWYLMLLTAYNATFWTWRGTTIGGIICQLRVVRLDGRPLQFGDSIIRGLSSLFSLLAFGIGFLWIGLDSNSERQAWHDQIAGTVVVRQPRSTPLR